MFFTGVPPTGMCVPAAASSPQLPHGCLPHTRPCRPSSRFSPTSALTLEHLLTSRVRSRRAYRIHIVLPPCTPLVFVGFGLVWAGIYNPILTAPRQADGSFKGYNTDWEAAISAIERGLAGVAGGAAAAAAAAAKNAGTPAAESPLKGRTVVVIGAGGAGRALAFGAAARCVREGERAGVGACGRRASEWAGGRAGGREGGRTSWS